MPSLMPGARKGEKKDERSNCHGITFVKSATSGTSYITAGVMLIAKMLLSILELWLSPEMAEHLILLFHVFLLFARWDHSFCLF